MPSLIYIFQILINFYKPELIMQRMEETEIEKFYDKYTNINKRLLRAVGLWPQVEGKVDSIWRRALTIFYIFVLLSLTLTQFYHIYLIWGNFFDCLEILCNTTTSLLIVHKAVVFFFKQHIILDFEAQGRKMWITEFRDPDNTDAMISAAKVAHKLTYIFLSIVIFTIANFFFAPAVSIFYQWKSGKAPTEFVYVLPYLVKLPLDLTDSVQHAIAYVPVTICSVSLIFYISGIDAFYCLAIQHLVLHLQLLQRALIKLRLRSLDKKDKTKLALDYLRLCVEKHQAIIKHSYILEQIYSPIIFGLGVVSTLSMCMVIFHAIVTKGGHNGNVALFIVYFSMEFSEVLLYCWFGSSLIFASLEVGLALYDIDWYNAQQDNEAFPTCVHIMMIRIQKPIKLTALKFADVSLILFTNIMSTTASYFALLKTLYTS